MHGCVAWSSTLKIGVGRGLCLTAGAALSIASVGAGATTVSVSLSTPVVAQEKTKRLSVAAARKAVGDGRALVTAGRHADAIALLTSAIDSRRLRTKELAQALYQRGLGYRATNRAAKAIADFTSALWIKNGLPEADKKAALAARAATYQAAGLSGQGQTNTAALPTVKAPVAPATASVAPTTSAAANPATSRVVAGGPSTPVRRPARTAAVAAPSGAVAGSQSSTGWQSASVQRSPAPAPASNSANSGNSFTNFFSGWFGGGSASPGAATQPTVTGSTAPRSVASAGTGRRSAPASAVSGWSSVTAVKPGAARAEATRRQAAATPRGSVKMQVTAVRRRTDARKVADYVNQKYGGILNGQTAQISQVQIGNLGTMFRVELGPFTSEAGSQPACAQLRKDGFDCLRIR